MVDTIKPFLSVPEVAEVLGVRPVTIYRWCRAGRLASVKIGKEWRIARAALDDLLGRSASGGLGRQGDGEEPMHEASPETRDLARRLLRRHAGAHREVAALARAAERACERLRQQLLPLIGRLAFLVLLRRALRLAQAAFPALADLAVDGEAEPGLAGTGAFAAAHADDAALVEAALAAILAHFIGLLDTFIGEALTRRALGEQWPARTGGAETAT